MKTIRGKNIIFCILLCKGDKITLSHTVICSKGQDLPFVCTASDAFTINPLMELWDGIKLFFLSTELLYSL